MGNFSEENLSELKEFVVKNIKKSQATCSEYPLQGRKDKYAVYRDLMTSLMVCHNVTITIDNGERDLSAASPDEISLVKFGERMGYYLLERTNKVIKIRNPLKGIEEYEILQNFPFTSDRKRMGILVKDKKSGKYIFFLKGADSVIKPRVSPLECSFIEEECEALAREGLRTLAITQKVLSENQYLEWNEKMKKAGKDYKMRDELEQKCIEELESK